MFADFLQREVEPFYPEWELEARVPRSLLLRLGDIGVIGMNMPTEFGGGGEVDYAYNAIVQEETAKALVTLGTLRTHMDIVLPYFRAYANEEQRHAVVPANLSRGNLFTAIAMTEPDTGSDLAGVRTSAVRDGDTYVVNGAKTFISGGEVRGPRHRSRPHRRKTISNRRHGLSLLVVEDGMAGFVKGRRLDKLGLHMQDTVELSFDDVPVPVVISSGEEDWHSRTSAIISLRSALLSPPARLPKHR